MAFLSTQRTKMMSYETSKKFMTDWLESMQNENSERSRTTYGKEYVLFCLDRGIQPEWDTSCAMFLRWGLEVKERARSTIVNSMSGGVYNRFEFTPHTPTKGPLSKATRAVIYRMTKPSKGKLFLPISLVRRICENTNTESFAEIRDALLITFMTLGCLRQDNAVWLRRKDVWIDTAPNGEETIFIFLESRKKDQ